MRCFVALWPDADVRARLDAIAQETRGRLRTGRLVAAANLHLTLAFIGTLDPAKAGAVARHLSAADFQPFVWNLDRIGHFSRAGVVWAAGPAMPSLMRLAADVRTRLDGLGVTYDRKPFVPHVTLLRDAPRAEAVAGPVQTPVLWPVSSPRSGPVLLKSEFVGGRPTYRPVA